MAQGRWHMLRELCLAGLSAYPLFMQKHWFQPENAGALRAHIKTIILELFLAQVRCPVSPAMLSVCLQIQGTLRDSSSSALTGHHSIRHVQQSWL